MTTLLVASEGGHLVELQLIAKRLGVGERAWATFDSVQSRSLLAGEQVHLAPFAGSRDVRGTARATVWARDLLAHYAFDTVISTGASIALSVLPLAVRGGADCYYIESAARTCGPSVTGRLLQAFRPIHLFTQYERWANRRWRYGVSIYDIFRVVPTAPRSEPRSVVVSLGLHQNAGFRRAVERIAAIIPRNAQVLWQTGDTDTSGLGIESHVRVPAAELARAMAESDAVITHAGAGSIASALEAGKMPVVLPRRLRFREHVDDHQAYIAAELERRGLVVTAEADEITWSDVATAASSRVEVVSASIESVLLPLKRAGR